MRGAAIIQGITNFTANAIAGMVGSASFAGLSSIVANAAAKLRAGSLFSGSTSFSANGIVHGVQLGSLVVMGDYGFGVSALPILSTSNSARSKMFNGGTIASIGEMSSLIPLVSTVEGSNGENICYGMADPIFAALGNGLIASIATQGGDRCYLSQSGTTTYNLAKSQVTNGMSLAGASYGGVFGVVWYGGYEDQNWGRTDYASNLTLLQSTLETSLKAITGQSTDIPLFVHQQTILSAGLGAVSPTFAASSAIQALAAHEANPTKIILVGPDYVYPVFNSATTGPMNHGQRATGLMFSRAAIKFKQSGAWSPLRPISCVRSGANIDIQFSVPTPPIVFDLGRVLNPGWTIANNVYGFSYLDDSSSATVISASVIASDTVRLTLSAVPTGTNQKVRYGCNSAADSTMKCAGPISAARGNLRDSNVESNVYGYDSYNWSVIFEKAVT